MRSEKWYDVILTFIKTNKLGTIGAVVVISFIVLGVFSPQIAPLDPNKIDLQNALAPPGGTAILGTDHNGRDVLSRIIFGARISLFISFSAIFVGSIIGTTLGISAGWFKSLEMPIMRFMDVLLCFPGIITALTIISILGSGLGNVVVAIAAYQIPQFARLAHGQTLTVKENDYVTAALSLGVPDFRILFRHILPNITASMIVQMSLLIPGAILTTASLSFLGLGVTPPTAEWGGMLQDSMKWARMAPHVMIFPGLALMLVVFGFNTLGDGLRVSMDPRMRGRS